MCVCVLKQVTNVVGFSCVLLLGLHFYFTFVVSPVVSLLVASVLKFILVLRLKLLLAVIPTVTLAGQVLLVCCPSVLL